MLKQRFFEETFDLLRILKYSQGAFPQLNTFEVFKNKVSILHTLRVHEVFNKERNVLC